MAGATTTAPSYPVPYNFGAAITAELTAPGSSPPGSNNWSCKPSVTHPEPVILVHGLSANQTDNWQTMSPLLADNGYCVFALTYGTTPGAVFPLNQVGGLIPMQQSATQLSAFVQRVRAATGAAKVDLVGHSEGTLMPEWYLKFDGGAAFVKRYVAVAPLYQGTNAAGLATLDNLATTFGFSPVVNGIVNPLCGSCQQFLHGSSYLQQINSGSGPAVPGVTYTTIMTRYDELVVPYTSGYLNAPNATNIVVQDQCPLDFSDHLAVIADPVTGQDILNALDPTHPGPVPCTLVLPFIGSPLFG